MRSPDKPFLEVNPEQSEIYTIQTADNLQSVEVSSIDSIVFDSKEFLASFKTSVKEHELRSGGGTRASDIEFLMDINSEGQQLVNRQTEQLQRILGSKKYPDSHEAKYKEHFLKSVNNLGRWSLNLAGRGQPEYLKELKDPARRQAILIQLARDYRRNAVEIAKADAKPDLSPTIWPSSKPHIFATEEITGYLKKYNKLGTSVVKTILSRNLHDIDVKLEQTGDAIKKFSKNPKYKTLGIQAIKSAVVDRPKNPEAFLDRILDGVSELSANTENEEVMNSSIMQKFVTDNPKEFRQQTENYIKVFNRVSSNPVYKDLGKSMVRVALRRDINDPEAVLDQMLTTYDTLCAEEAFADIPANIKKRVAKTWIDEERAFSTLYKVLATYSKLTKTTKYTDFMGSGTLLQYVYNNQHNTKKSLDKLLRNFSKFMSIPEYAELGESAIKNALHISPKNPKRKLDQILKVYEDAKSDPKYRILPISCKKVAATKYANSYKNYLDVRLKKWEDFIEDNQLAEKFARYTIEEVIIDNPNHATRRLLKASELFDRNMDDVDLSNLNRHFLGYACINRAKDIREYLEESRTEVIALVNNPMYVGFSVEMVGIAMLKNPDNPKEVLNNLVAVAEEYLSDERFACLEARSIRKAVYLYGPEKAKEILLYLSNAKK